MLKATFKKYKFFFKTPSGTSRGVLSFKESWFISVWDDNNSDIIGFGECGLLKGLSIDNLGNYESTLEGVCKNIDSINPDDLKDYPSIRFGIEMALLDLNSKGEKILFHNSFTEGNSSQKINGLIWMGNKESMFNQIKAKIDNGFSCVKLKIGAINFQDELDLLKYIRQHFTENEIELRVDANGAFNPESALEKLKQLSEYKLHSIEQPIKQGQIEEMAKLCSTTPLDIALDEELIGVNDITKKELLLKTIKPQYIILKPSLLGGFKATEEWINLANELNTPWWITSALESNVGLSAIAQFTSTFNTNMYQGLGTGQLYTNNFDCPLQLDGENLSYNPNNIWNLDLLND